MESFHRMIKLIENELLAFCCQLTKDKWIGEDLYQEVIVKAYIAYEKIPERSLKKAYFYQIARTTWIDICRKKKDESIESIDRLQVEKPTDIELAETFEALAQLLPPKPFVILLLVDVYLFTGKETAEMLKESESNVHTTLHRTRKTLRALHEKTDIAHKHRQLRRDFIPTIEMPYLFRDFLQAFRSGNPKAIQEAYLTFRYLNYEVKHLKKSGNSIYFHILDPDGHVLTITT